jgi:hypothetical protein
MRSAPGGSSGAAHCSTGQLAAASCGGTTGTRTLFRSLAGGPPAIAPIATPVFRSEQSTGPGGRRRRHPQCAVGWQSRPARRVHCCITMLGTSRRNDAAKSSLHGRGSVRRSDPWRIRAAGAAEGRWQRRRQISRRRRRGGGGVGDGGGGGVGDSGGGGVGDRGGVGDSGGGGVGTARAAAALGTARATTGDDSEGGVGGSTSDCRG